MAEGYLCLALHAHLPFVRHPEHPDFLEEDWLFEAITECYVPLLRLFDRLASENIPFRLTMTLSPPLCEMLADPLLQERYVQRIAKLRALTVRARDRVAGPFRPALERHCRLFAEAEETFTRSPLLLSFRRLQEMGRLEIITSAATHAYLPHLHRSEACRAQIRVAIRNYEKHFGRRPRGIWLPECGYFPGLDRSLAEEGLQFFFVDAHSLGDGFQTPIRTPAGVLALPRDSESSQQVWSAQEGYPGDPVYREFYRDLGFDEEAEFLRPLLHPDGIRRNLGVKLHRITGNVPLGEKGSYDPFMAEGRATEHAAQFHASRLEQLRGLRRRYGIAPVLTSPYDAELFGHWWFEGPIFLEQLLRKIAATPEQMVAVSPLDLPAAEYPIREPSLSSWGSNGYSEMWLNGSNEWIYRHLDHAVDRMIVMARANPVAEGMLRRALNQVARELLLAQSSDWPFLMSTGSSVPYAHRRFRTHLNRFLKLADQIQGGQIDERDLLDCEMKDSIFPEIEYREFV